jgi:hypothetical protein
MSAQFRLPQNTLHQIGSKSRSLLRLSMLFTVSLIFLAFHYLFLSKLTNWLLATALLVGTWTAVFLRMHSSVRGWIDFLLRDSAYGVVKEDGIQYRSMLRSRFVPWSSVERIEYSPRNGNRIDVFKVGAFRFTQVRPIHFGPAPANAIAVQEIANIFGQLGAIKKLVTTTRYLGSSFTYRRAMCPHPTLGNPTLRQQSSSSAFETD